MDVQLSPGATPADVAGIIEDAILDAAGKGVWQVAVSRPGVIALFGTKRGELRAVEVDTTRPGVRRVVGRPSVPAG